VHTPVDGDVIFVMATGAKMLSDAALMQVSLLGSIAADCVARAIGRAVFEADALGPWEAYRTVHAKGFSTRT
jgi:L-aminopeptidase/D-esterase-like protein